MSPQSSGSGFSRINGSERSVKIQKPGKQLTCLGVLHSIGTNPKVPLTQLPETGTFARIKGSSSTWNAIERIPTPSAPFRLERGSGNHPELKR